MLEERKAQAQRHIENVVAAYRSDPSRTNYHWEVKPAYKIPWTGYCGALVLALSLFAGITIRIYDYGKYNGLVVMLGFAPLAIILLFRFITKRLKYFQEKSWSNDVVCDEDIIRLCENQDLKPLIKDEVEHGYILTYTTLLEELPDYLTRIDVWRAKMQRDELMRKIDQI